MTKKAVLSVFMPNYNHGQYISRAIEAIINQSRPPDEFVIVDDGSTDNSVEIISRYTQRYNWIRLVRNERKTGVLAAMERGIGMTTGDYLYGAAADDYVLPGFFEKALDMAARYPQTGLICGQVVYTNEQGQEFHINEITCWQHSLFASPEAFLRDYLNVESPGHSLSAATIYRRRAFEEVGGFRKELGSWCDSFACRAAALKYGACYLAEPCTIFTSLPDSFSRLTDRDSKQLLDIIARAAWLMRSPEFRDYFPKEHVEWWKAHYRRHVIWCHAEELKRSFDHSREIYLRNILGDSWMERLIAFLFSTWNYWEKYLWALSLRGLQHLFYEGDTSCYTR